ncbi:MAG: hypothetical protein ISS70_09625 [Phycisphaerae bacterium]|nr:hypothetical protein [Phycisphaerae bacterium]
MGSDIFGNLIDWGHIIETLDRLIELKQLDRYQDGLTRILRYRDNWRLRETVLKHIVHLAEPTEELVHEVINIAVDEDTYLDMRILAFDALSHLIPLCIKRNDIKGHNLVETAIENMNKLLNSPQPPIFHEVVTKALKTIKKTQENRF